MLDWVGERLEQGSVSVGLPDLFRTDSVSNPKYVKMDISRTLSDLYAQEWNAKDNVCSKGKYHLKTISILKKKDLYYSKVIKYRRGNHRLPVET